MKPPAGDRRPFLGYSDDPARSADVEEGPPSPFAPQDVPSEQKRHRFARDLLVFLLASLVWLAAIFLFLPGPVPPPSPTPSSSTAAAAAASAGAAAASAEQQGAVMSGGGGDFRTHNITSDARWVSCGGSPAEAEGMGCRYDALLNHWVPAPCVDQEWIDEYQDDDSWAAFAEYVSRAPFAPPPLFLSFFFFFFVFHFPSCFSPNSHLLADMEAGRQREPHAAALARGHGPEGPLLHVDPRPRQPLRGAVAEAVLDAV